MNHPQRIRNLVWFRRLALSLLATTLLVSQSGCENASIAETSDAAGSAAAEGAAIERVTAGKPQRKSLTRTTTQPARIEAFEETPVYSKINGYAESVLVDIGDRVERGQPLVKLWVPELKDALAQKQALLAQATAEVHQAAAAIKAAEAAAETAQARVREAEAGILRAEGEYRRWKAESSRIEQLVSSGSVTRKLADETLHQFQSADASRQEAAARVQSAEAAAHQAISNVDSATADQAAAQARVRVAEANVAESQTLLGYTDLKSPFDGIITRRHVDTGHYVQPASNNSQPLLVVCHADVVRVFIDVPEMEAAMVDKGDKAVIQLQSLQGKEITGEVARTGWALDRANRSLSVEIDVDNSEGVLRPGMYATATIVLDERSEALVVPVAAVVRQGSDAYCCKIVDGRVAHAPVQLGLRSGAEVEITSGLTGDETIVVARADGLKAGQRVDIIPAEPKP